MHRALVIRLGETFSPATNALIREYEARRESGTLSVQAAFIEAPVAGVGNLSKPITALRERLQEEIDTAISGLLQASPGTDDLLLDIVLFGSLGEPLVAGATTVVVDMVNAVIDADFGTVFPAHRRGSLRRLRIIPILALPSSRECEKDRSEAVSELAELLENVELRVNESAGREFPIDRLFLLDAVTTRGLTPIRDVVDQARSFVRLLLFSGLRRDPAIVTAIESQTNDLFASFGIVCGEIDYLAVRDHLAHRMTTQSARALSSGGVVALPPVSELMPSSALDNAAIRARVVEELNALPIRTLEVDGSAALEPLRTLYLELSEQLEVWADRASSEPPARNEQTESPSVPSSVGGATAAGLALGGGVFGLAHFGLLLSMGASAATGGLFAVVAFATVMLLTRSRADDTPSSEVAAEDASRLESTQALDSLSVAVDDRLSELRGLLERIEAMSASFEIAGTPETDDPESTPSPFCVPISSPQLLELLHERNVNEADARAVGDAWLQSLGTWDELLAGNVRVDAASLESFSADHFRDLGGQPLFADADCRGCIAHALDDLVARWKSGVAPMLEGESRKQFDPDGFRHVIDSAVFVPSDLTADLQARLDAASSAMTIHRTASTMDDIFFVSVLLDVHPDAVAPLAEIEN